MGAGATKRLSAVRWGVAGNIVTAWVLTIPAAAALKLPELFGHQGDGVRGQALVGALCAAVTAYLAVRFLMRFFETNRLTPFAVYCALAGSAALVYLVLS